MADEKLTRILPGTDRITGKEEDETVERLPELSYGQREIINLYIYQNKYRHLDMGVQFYVITH